MNPLISTILLWERRLELGHHQAHLARRDRFKSRTSPTPTTDGPAAVDEVGTSARAGDRSPVPACGRGQGSQSPASGSEVRA